MARASLRRQTIQRPERGLDRSPASIRVRGNKLSVPNKLLTFIDEREAAERFSTVAQGFSTGQLATLSRSTKGTAKNWKAGRYFPNGASLINLARNNPAIRKWLLHEMGETAEYDDPRALARAMVLLQQAQKELT